MARQFLNDLDGNNQSTIINLPAPANDGDAANKQYVDSAVEGLAFKGSVRVASTANINLAAPGASIDGITMAADDRFLVKDQTTGHENGIYIWNGAAVPATRAPDAATADDLEQAVTSVEEGTSASSTFRQTAVNFTLDADDVIWTSFGTAAPSASESTAGIAEIATQAEADAGSDDSRMITPAKMANWSGRKLKHDQLIGDGASTSFNVDHNLGTRDVTVQVYRDSGNYDEVIVDVTRPTVNRVTLEFASAPASNAFKVVIIG